MLKTKTAHFTMSKPVASRSTELVSTQIYAGKNILHCAPPNQKPLRGFRRVS